MNEHRLPVKVVPFMNAAMLEAPAVVAAALWNTKSSISVVAPLTVMGIPLVGFMVAKSLALYAHVEQSRPAYRLTLDARVMFSG